MKKNLISLIIAMALCFSVNLNAQLQGDWEGLGGLYSTSVLSITSNNDTLFFGTDGEGIIRSTDNGGTWSAVNSGLSNLTVRALCANDTNIFAGTAAGVFLSTNNGESWTAANNGLTNTNIYAIANIGSNIFVGTNGGGMFISTNNGLNWTAINNGLNATYIRAISVYDNVLYVGTAYSSGIGGVYVSSNNGSNWSQIYTSLTYIHVTSILASASNLFVGTGGGGVFYSSDGGANWGQVNNGLTDNNIRCLAFWGNNIFAATNEKGIFKSTNNGLEWFEANNGIFNLVMNCFYIKDNNLIVANTGSVFISSNNGESWSNFFSGINPTLNIKVLGIKGSNLIAGTNKGMYLSTNLGATWNQTFSQSQGSYFNPKNILKSGNLFYIYNGDRIHYTTNTGNSWIEIFHWHITDYALKGKYLFITVGGHYPGLSLTTNNGLEWTRKYNFYSASIAVSGNNIYTDGSNGNILKSQNNFITWSTTNIGTNSEISQIFAKDSNVYAGTFTGIYRSTDYGANWSLFNEGLSLSNYYNNSFASLNEYTFIGTSNGLYYTSSNDSTWNFAGFSNQSVQTIAFDNNYIYVGTSENGIFRRALNLQQIALSSPPLSSPQNEETDITISPNLIWEEVQTSTSYHLQVSNSNTFETITYEEVLNNNEITLSNLEFNTTYFWRVAAIRGELTSQWSEVWCFMTRPEFYGISLVSPENNSSNLSISPSFFWNTQDLASQYQLQLSTSFQFSTISNEITVTDTTATIQNLLLNTKYYWRVRAMSSSDTSVWSASWNFYTRPVFYQIVLVTPANNSTNITTSPTFYWKSEDYASHYQLQLSTNLQFSTIVNDLIITDTTATIQNLLTNTQYFWRVRAMNTVDTSFWSYPWKFATRKLNKPYLISPQHLTCKTTPPFIFKWLVENISTNSQFQLALDINFNNIIIDENIADTTYSVASLNLNNNYYWRVKSMSSNDTSAWSGVNALFTIQPSQWTLQNSGTYQWLNDVHFIDENTGWAVGDVVGNYAQIRKTTNGGTNWVAQTILVTSGLLGVHFIDENIGWVVGNGGTIRKTTDGGTNWLYQSSGSSLFLKCVHFIDENIGYCVGNQGRIIFTTNGGSNWGVQSSGTTNILTGVYFTDTNTGWAVGSSGTIIKTTDGGTNWFSQTSGTTQTLNSVHFVDENTGWAVGSSGTIRKTNDGGTNWITQTSGTSNSLNGVNFVDANTVWAVGSSGTIIKTMDGGDFWFSQASGTTRDLAKVYFINENTGWAVGGYQTILKHSVILEFPTLDSPLNNSVNVSTSPALNWNEVPAASSYTLQVSLTNNFVNTIVNQSGIEETEFQLSGLEYNTTYYWRVNATNGDQTSNWTVVWSFTTASTNQFIDIDLNTGWNTISNNIIPNAPNMEDIFTEMEELVIVKNADGQIYNPSQSINQIGDWNIAHGYMVYITAPATLQITGTAVNPTETEINLVSGWNLVSYLRNSQMPTETALASIYSSLILVKNNLGQLYYPAYGLNTIGNMQQGQGYWIYMNSNAVLVYPVN